MADVPRHPFPHSYDKEDVLWGSLGSVCRKRTRRWKEVHVAE